MGLPEPSPFGREQGEVKIGARFYAGCRILSKLQKLV
jgi:hypothetical protein